MSRRQPSQPPDIEGFTYIGLLGSGGFADVFRYEDSRLGRQVAVKVLLHDQADGEASFRDEARLMAKISNHPNIVSVYSDGVASDGRPYLVMEYCHGPHLNAQIRSRPMLVIRTLDYVVQLSGAVETARRRGILHRDIKPANILFTEFNRPALTDFGISVPTAADGTGQGVGLSMAWAPPEQIVAGQNAQASSDVYSLAATMHHMLTGHSPFYAKDQSDYELGRRIRLEPRPLTARADVPDSLERILSVAMAKIPGDRFNTAQDFARALQAVQIELRHPPTECQVVVDTSIAQFDANIDDDGGTELAGLIDPTDLGAAVDFTARSTGGRSEVRVGDRSEDFIELGRGIADPVDPLEWTGHTSMAVAQADPLPAEDPAADVVPEAAPTPKAKGFRTRWRVLAGVLAGVLGIGGWAVLQQTTGGATTKNSPASQGPVPSHSAADPLAGLVPAPTAGSAAPAGKEKIVFSWQNAAPQPDDEFLYRVVDPVNPGDYIVSKEPTAVVSTQPGRTCLEVLLRRTSGHASDSAVFCYPAASVAPS